MSRAAEVALPGASRSSAPDLRSLLNAGVLGRAALVALGLGTVLTLANQGEAVFGAGNLEILPLILVYLTPFIVVTVSQLLGVRQAKLDAPGGPTDEIFSSTALRHGIPARALLLGLLVGGLGAALVMTVAHLERGDLDGVSWPLLAQGSALPVLFGLLAQAIACRRSPPVPRPDTMSNQDRLLDTKTIRLKGLGLEARYAELGDRGKPTVLLLHGVPENLQAWYAVAPLLAERYHVLALDWPGFGGSDALASPEDYTSLRFAQVIVDFMDSLGIQQASLVATDIALLPSLLVGLEHPSRVKKLAVMDGIPFPRPQYSSWELRSFAKKGSILGRALVRWFPRVTAQISYLKGFYRGHSIPAEVRREFAADGVRKSTQAAFLSYFQNFHLGQKYFEPRAHRLEKPVLVVWGKYDRFIDVGLAHEIVEKLPNARLEIIDKSGHYVHMDKPEELVELVTTFLDVAA